MKRSLIGVAAVASALAGAAAMAADVTSAPSPAAQKTAWSTYLRSGPGDAYPVLDELEHDTLVTVGGCSGRWCRIMKGSVSGYVDRDALMLPRPAPLAATVAGAETCFVADQPGYRRPAPTRFCQPQSTGAGASH